MLLRHPNQEDQVPFADKEKQRAYYREYRKRPGRKEVVQRYKKKWFVENPDKVRLYAARYKERKMQDPEKYRAYFRNLRIKKVYGITPEQFEQMLQDQGGVCAICGRLPNGTNHVEKALVIDHCHGTGKVRGLLCNNCNSGIGIIGDTIAHLEAAIAYLKRFEQEIPQEA